MFALYPAIKNPHKVSKYVPYADKLDFTGIQFPVQIKDIEKFEKQNDLLVNVFLVSKRRDVSYSFDKPTVSTLRRSFGYIQWTAIALLLD